VGYLPESNPLYPDMYITEFLEFIAGIFHIKNKKKRIADLLEITGLTVERRKKIGALSKGYKQRVGIAQALMQDPKVLILDEPTSGLDPNQLTEIRELIKNLGKEKTVLLSTHIMQEVQSICDRILIINNGILVADDSPDNLIEENKTEICIEVQFRKRINIELLEDIEIVQRATEKEDCTYLVYGQNEDLLKDELFSLAVKLENPLLNLSSSVSSLEDVFQKLTKPT